MLNVRKLKEDGLFTIENSYIKLGVSEKKEGNEQVNFECFSDLTINKIQTGKFISVKKTEKEISLLEG